MSVNKILIVNNNPAWRVNGRYRINFVVTFSGNSYQNKTGKNTSPDLLVDWVKTSSSLIEPLLYNAIATGTNQVIPNVPFQVGTVLKSRSELYKGTEWTQSGSNVTIIVSVTSGNTLYLKP